MIWGGVQLGEERHEVLAGERPLEGLRGHFVAGLKGQQPVFHLGQGGERCGRISAAIRSRLFDKTVAAPTKTSNRSRPTSMSPNSENGGILVERASRGPGPQRASQAPPVSARWALAGVVPPPSASSGSRASN